MGIKITWSNYLGSGKPFSTMAYPLDEATINDIVPDNKPHGNYKIYQKRLVDGKEKYRVIYIGRTADRTSDLGLKARIKDHVKEWEGELFFDFVVQNSAKAAYEQECRDYHNWTERGCAIYNEYHPAKMDDNDKCPVCGE